MSLFILITLAAFYIVYVVTMSSYPPVEWLHKKLEDKVQGLADDYAAALVDVGFRMLENWEQRLAHRHRIFKRWRHINKFVTCPWCLGAWITFATFLVADVYYKHIAHQGLASPVLQALAGAAIVGLLGNIVASLQS